MAQITRLVGIPSETIDQVTRLAEDVGCPVQSTLVAAIEFFDPAARSEHRHFLDRYCGREGSDGGQAEFGILSETERQQILRILNARK